MNINELGKKYGLDGETDVWVVRPGVYAIKHDAVMKIADKEGIVFDKPDIHVNGDSVAMVGVARRVIEGASVISSISTWATGEAGPSNCTAKYYWAMAEKRLKDRLTLKLINAYEYGIYSEEEADAFKKQS